MSATGPPGGGLIRLDDGADRVPTTPPDGARPTRPSRGAVPRGLEIGAAWSWRLVVVVGTVLALGWLLAQLSLVLIPIFVAVIVTALLNPLVDFCDRRMPRLAAAWLVLLGMLGGLGLLGYLLQAPIRSAVGDIRGSWADARDEIERWLREGPLGLSQARIDDLAEGLTESGRRAVTGFAGGPTGAARLAAEIVTGLLLAIVLTFFFLKDGRNMWTWMLERVAPVRRRTVDRGGQAAFKALTGWIRGVAITGLVDGFFIGIALLVLGVPAAVPLAVITFFAAFIPIVGATLAGALAAAIALATEGPTTALIVVIVVLVVQQVEGDILLPMIMYRQVRLHPVVILVSLTAGAAIGGIVGAIVSVPLTAAVAAAVSAGRASHEERLLAPAEP